MSISGSAAAPLAAASTPREATTGARHSFTVRATHWITVACFFALLLSGIEILISHPRFYWGETGNDLTAPLFKIPIPSSRKHVPTGYSYTLPDQNGWSRALHFQSAWLFVITGLAYLLFGIFAGHFRRTLVPSQSQRSWRSIGEVVFHHLRFKPPHPSEAWSYNVLQRLSYLVVIFAAAPLLVWTGLAMSPAFVSAFPWSVALLGGRQTARTLHFFLSIALLLFFFVHVVMVWRAGFWSRLKPMITGRVSQPSERV